MRLYEYSVIIGSFVATGTEVYLEFYPNQSATSNEEVTNYYDIQLELGSTATPYEPFVPNSPSPDYPSAIVNSGGYYGGKYREAVTLTEI